MRVLIFGFMVFVLGLAGCRVEANYKSNPPPINEVFEFIEASSQNPKYKSDFEKAYNSIWASDNKLILTLHKYRFDLNIEVYGLNNGTMPGQIDTIADDYRGGIIVYGNPTDEEFELSLKMVLNEFKEFIEWLTEED